VQPLARKNRSSGEHEVDDFAQRIDISCRRNIAMAATFKFGRHELDGSDHFAV
jgi:hypothetical protein